MSSFTILLLFGLGVAPPPAGPAPEVAAAAATREASDSMERVRELYFAAVQSSDALAAAEREVERRLKGAPALTPELEAVLTAYGGALRTLRAKHGLWPPARLRDLQDGLTILDSVVARHPHLPEPRYLRLMSCYYLPAILGRNGSVREDFTALARLLPGARAEFSAELYTAVATFVLEKGDLSAALRHPLELSLDR